MCNIISFSSKKLDDGTITNNVSTSHVQASALESAKDSIAQEHMEKYFCVNDMNEIHYMNGFVLRK